MSDNLVDTALLDVIFFSFNFFEYKNFRVTVGL